ncbi:PTS glucose transporter subunit IIA [Enterococcus faecium]|nr:PTS glucose transporter subunit IIA [Enterococcus faecium]HCA4693793.1 PTS glucose transporter subunit IIA [Enterococcus faecium]HCA4966264.1 PTS glucose transporter subunit IIA [Enterococcus faecium]HCA4999755.1 PTS glucose transporter subunit IIA [Enterococcus faecium]HCA5173184.1 PTS glucose transporter subunit IIA [Enterococcus faecium]
MLNFFRKNEISVVAPATGVFEKLEKLSDPVFSKGMMGQGFAIDAKNETIVSPIDGFVSSIFPTKHALGIKTKSGIEILVHVGIDTVELNGEGFDIKVQEGQKVKAGDILMTINFVVFEKNHKTKDVIVVFPDYQDEISIPKLEEVKQGQELFVLG